MPQRACETLADQVAGMDRPALIRTLRGLRCDFPLDFTDGFLASVSIERLRHIVLAASLHARNVDSADKVPA